MEIKIYQSEWHGLKFKDLDVELSSSRLPDAHFYSNFYGALQKKYSSYEDIDKDWLSHKINTAANLLKNCAESSNILGYGCGIAYIESIIAFCLPSATVHGYDFSDNFKHFSKSTQIENLKNLHLFSKYKNPLELATYKYDTIYACQLLYAMNEEEIKKLFRRISASLKQGGSFIIAHYPPSNKIKLLVRGVIPARAIDLYKNIRTGRVKSQFWGWSRDDNFYIRLCKNEGMILKTKYRDELNQSFLVFQLS